MQCAKCCGLVLDFLGIVVTDYSSCYTQQMPRFAYRAKDNQLKVVEGTIEADSESAAISRLGNLGVFPITINESQLVLPIKRFTRRRVSPSVLAYNSRQLADLIGGGIPLLNALILLEKQTAHKTLRAVIGSLITDVRDGSSYSEGLSSHPEVFPPLFVSMIRAGEAGGDLEKALVHLAELGENEAELRSRIVNASVYPLIVLVVAFFAVLFLVIWVIPALSEVFFESGQLLPLPTRILLGISDAVVNWWWSIGALILGLGLLVWQWYESPAGKETVDRVIIALPGFGTLSRKMNTARFVRNLGVMISQGVPVLQALDVASSNLSNSVLQRAVLRVEGAVREGSSIADALTESGQFPVFVSNMVAVGEESGSVDVALLKVASSYERDVDRTIRLLTTIIEPLLLLVIGGVVMFIVLSMLLPVFQLGLVVQ